MLCGAPGRAVSAVLLILPAWAVLAAAAGAAPVAIYIDGGSDGTVEAGVLLNLLAPFADEVEVRPVAGYAAGDLAGFAAAFYIGTDHFAAMPDAFLLDAVTGTTPLFWIAGGLFRFAERGLPPPPGIEYAEWVADDGRDRIRYKGREIARDPGDLSYHKIVVSPPAEVLSALADAGEALPEVPHVARSGRFFFLAENPLYSFGTDRRALVLCDLLHLFFATGVPETRRAMVRLEDILPGATDPERLRQVADGLQERGIPFSFGVIPVLRDPQGLLGRGPLEVRLAQDPELVAALADLVRGGGTMIMHGVTHQHGDEMSSLGWEFLDGATGTPFPEDGEDWVRARIEWGLAEFAAAGFRPRVWETPHYGASHGTYFVVADYFDVIYEDFVVYDLPADGGPAWGYEGARAAVEPPYFLPWSIYGPAVLPETLGYYSSEPPGVPAEGILDAAEDVSVVRDGVASFFFHPRLYDPAVLLDIVDELAARGFAFVGPADLYTGRLDPWPDDDDSAGDEAEHAGDDGEDEAGCGC